jgi:hypothetical protein
VRSGLMPYIAGMSMAVIATVPGMTEDQIAAPAHAEIAQLSDVPDGAQLIDLYKSARTVADIEAVNGKVKDQVAKVHMLASDLARFHAAAMNSCEAGDQSRIEVAGSKARNLSATVSRIDGELAKSLAAMRQKLATERSTSTRAKDDLNRLTMAAHQLGRLDTQAQELAKAVNGVAQSISSNSVSCMPTQIPPLFAEATPHRVAGSIARSRPVGRKRSRKRRKETRFFPVW